MGRDKQTSNPLALAVLVLLFERPMHPYEMAATLRIRNKGGSIKLRYGSLYTVIDALTAEGLIEVKETVREGRRPERTIYAMTPSGLERMRVWMRDLIGTPVKEYPQFEAALSLLPAVPPDEAVALLEARGAGWARCARSFAPPLSWHSSMSRRFTWLRTSTALSSWRPNSSSSSGSSSGSETTKTTCGAGRRSTPIPRGRKAPDQKPERPPARRVNSVPGGH